MVLHRFATAEALGVPILYHMNNICYKAFTLKRKLEAAERKRKLDEGQLFLSNTMLRWFGIQNFLQ